MHESTTCFEMQTIHTPCPLAVICLVNWFHGAESFFRR